VPPCLEIRREAMVAAWGRMGLAAAAWNPVAATARRRKPERAPEARSGRRRRKQGVSGGGCRLGTAGGDCRLGVVVGCHLYVVGGGIRGPDGLHGLDGPCDVFSFFFSFLLFWPCIIRVYFYIFLFLHITKASPHLTPYRLKGKKGVRRLESP
jgi:hypothetical protein